MKKVAVALLCLNFFQGLMFYSVWSDREDMIQKRQEEAQTRLLDLASEIQQSLADDVARHAPKNGNE